MSDDTTTTVRMFGALQIFRQEHGLPAETEVAIPAEGCAARILACELELPLERVEAVSVNHQIYSLEHCIRPGDEVAFIAAGIAGPARGVPGNCAAGRGASKAT